MNRLFTRRSTALLQLIGLILLSIILMVVDHRHQQYTQPLRYALSWVVTPLQYVVDQPLRLMNAVSLRLQTQHALIRENQELRAKQSLLEFQLQRLAALENENARLHALLGSTPEASDKAQLAEIVHVATQAFTQRVVLNQGKLQGVYAGQPVVDANGVIGQVLEVKPTTSIVLLISDITHALPVQNNRDGTRSIAVGTGSPYELELSYVPNSAEFAVGDLLVTSGLGDRFPSGYPVGVVTEVDANPGAAFMRIKVKPSAKLDKIREVLLVWPADTEPVVAAVVDDPTAELLDNE